MRYFTNEYTILINQNGGEDITLKPGVLNSFEAIVGQFKPTSFFRVMEVESKEIVGQYDVKDVFDGIGKAPQLIKRAVKKPQVDLLGEDDGEV